MSARTARIIREAPFSKEKAMHQNNKVTDSFIKFPPSGAAATAIEPTNDLVEIDWGFSYEEEHAQIISVYNVKPIDPRRTQIYMIGSAIQRADVIYASSYASSSTGLVSLDAPLPLEMWVGFIWTNNLTDRDRGKVVNGHVAGCVRHDGVTKYFEFEKQTTIPA